MASFQKHRSKNGTVTFRAQLFVNGVRDSKSGFASKADAKIWAAQREAQILCGTGEDKSSNNNHSTTQKVKTPSITSSSIVVAETPVRNLRDVFDRYLKEVSPKKPGFGPSLLHCQHQARKAWLNDSYKVRVFVSGLCLVLLKSLVGKDALLLEEIVQALMYTL